MSQIFPKVGSGGGGGGSPTAAVAGGARAAALRIRGKVRGVRESATAPSLPPPRGTLSLMTEFPTAGKASTVTPPLSPLRPLSRGWGNRPWDHLPRANLTKIDPSPPAFNPGRGEIDVHVICAGYAIARIRSSGLFFGVPGSLSDQPPKANPKNTDPSFFPSV